MLPIVLLTHPLPILSVLLCSWVGSVCGTTDYSGRLWSWKVEKADSAPLTEGQSYQFGDHFSSAKSLWLYVTPQSELLKDPYRPRAIGLTDDQRLKDVFSQSRGQASAIKTAWTHYAVDTYLRASEGVLYLVLRLPYHTAYFSKILGPSDSVLQEGFSFTARDPWVRYSQNQNLTYHGESIDWYNCPTIEPHGELMWSTATLPKVVDPDCVQVRLVKQNPRQIRA
ncbi:MAG: hypothetical protein M1838_002179 [Thelocarpon superellum]|nr:MAG: hypothetical protein M1838_002179 [Thelocarpon superellum]